MYSGTGNLQKDCYLSLFVHKQADLAPSEMLQPLHSMDLMVWGIEEVEEETLQSSNTFTRSINKFKRKI